MANNRVLLNTESENETPHVWVTQNEREIEAENMPEWESERVARMKRKE